MKNLSLLIIATVFLTFGVSNVVKATVDVDGNSATHDVGITIPQLALVDVEDANGDESNVSFTPDATDLVLEAGGALSFSSLSKTMYLQYTSIIGTGEGVSNKVSAVMETGYDLPSGLSLKLTTAAAVTGGTKKGTTGTGQGEITLSTTSADIVTGIGTCYTGTEGAYGHELTYKLDFAGDDAAYNALKHKAYSATVTYTITAN